MKMGLKWGGWILTAILSLIGRQVPADEGPPVPRCADGAKSARADLDGDGKRDCYRICYHGGSGFGGKRLTTQPGCKGPQLSLDSFGSFADFLGFIELPQGLAQKPALMNGALELLFGPEQLRAEVDSKALEPPPMDGSFRWLLDWYARPSLDKRAPFEEIRSYQPIWEVREAEAPVNQVSLLTQPGDIPAQRGKGKPLLAAYYAHNHGPLTKGAQCGMWQLWTSKHGVAIQHKKTGRLSWAFISTGPGVIKLRWPSLVKAYCADGLVYLERKLEQGQRRQLWLVNPAEGRMGLLPSGSKLGSDLKVHLPGGRLLSRSMIKAVLRADKNIKNY